MQYFEVGNEYSSHSLGEGFRAVLNEQLQRGKP